MRLTMKFWLIVSLLCEWNEFHSISTYAQHPDGSISLSQGTLIGLKIFPETSGTAVYSYLGIPYAQPPTDSLRFAPPRGHSGWGNRTLTVRNYKPICPQLQNYAFDELPNGFVHLIKTNEDCLYLNIWTPQSALRNGNHSVLVLITGEEQAFDWNQNRPSGLDLAAEGIVVVSIQSRTNVFGWLSLRNIEAPGNLGLLDQRMAFEWVKNNIQSFGGNPRQMTLLGHGTSGATNAMIHLSNSQTATLFARMIFMSGTVYSTYSYQSVERNGSVSRSMDPSMAIVRNLACDSTHIDHTLRCLRQKSVADLLKAFENVYKHGNYTKLLGPQVDSYLPKARRYIPVDPKTVLASHDYPDIPIVIGLCSNEGALMQELWLDLAREGYSRLKKYIESTLLPNILSHYGFANGTIEQVQQTINWRFFDQIPQTPAHLLSAMQRLISETKFESPFLETIEILADDRSTQNKTLNRNATDTEVITSTSKTSTPSNRESARFVYVFHHSRSMDIRGAINYFGGASHTSDLLFLMGPSLYQQISRRKLTATEMRLCRKMRKFFAEFVKTGNPTPGRIFDAWHPYTAKQKSIQTIGDNNVGYEVDILDGSLSTMSTFASEFNRNIDEIDNLIKKPNEQTHVVSNAANPYSIGKSNEPESTGESARMSKNYMGTQQSTDYYNSLMKINTFWTNLLPKINNYYGYDSSMFGEDGAIESRFDLGTDQLFIAGVVAKNEAKFKHAFFSMLILVCLLLTVLCVCLYILKKNQQNIDTSFL